MDEPIRVETVTTYEDYRSFSWFNALRRGPRLKTSFIVMLAALALALVSSALLAAMEGFTGLMEDAGKYLLILVLFVPGYFLLLSLMFKLTYKRTGNLLGSLQCYEFFADRLAIDTKGASVSGRSEFRYDVFYRVFEAGDAFYLYINKMQAFILPKRYFEGEAGKRLEEFLREKMGKRYVRCYKEKKSPLGKSPQ